ncbi:MAG: hypothetical protein WC080_01615 [Patescibacteria group bacterium]
MMKRVTLFVPVRADIAGGSTDISYYLKKLKADRGSVVNIALPVQVKVEAKLNGGKGIKLELPDLGEKIEGSIEDLIKQEKNNVSQIVRHFISLFNLKPDGLEIKVTSVGIIPSASGLGTSSAVGVGVIMALSELYEIPGVNVPELNYLVEMSMGILGGKQDYYAAWHGGMNYMTFGGPGYGEAKMIDHREENSPLYNWVLNHILVYYSGESRSSGKLNSQMRSGYEKNPLLIKKIAKNAEDIWRGILGKDLSMLKTGIANDRNLRLDLSSAYYTKNMKMMAKIAEKYGYSHRACGAGGGGCLLFCGDKSNKKLLLSELKKFGGYSVY